ncbi:MAG: hypothetical protein D3924_14905 [Candidatus Electrothrix sp. AR4]|nr:hypothetical protein [Candidatus Electrothrix sp. AR4]
MASKCKYKCPFTASSEIVEIEYSNKKYKSIWSGSLSTDVTCRLVNNISHCSGWDSCGVRVKKGYKQFFFKSKCPVMLSLVDILM